MWMPQDVQLCPTYLGIRLVTGEPVLYYNSIDNTLSLARLDHCGYRLQ